ncbi:MAG TPA: GNAT family N-acyltransferase [Anaerolineae bacterium]|jgi:N-acyl-L-homoserine lactone synthetase
MVQLSPPDDATLATLRAIAETMLTKAAPLCFRAARCDADRTAIYRMRYNTIVERGWGKPDDMPSGLERDEYDDRALHIIGMDGQTPVASARLVFPADGQILPSEQAFGLHIEPHDHVVDLSRQIVIRAYSSQQHSIFSALLSQCWLEAQTRGYYYVCGDFTPAMIRLYRRLGMEVNILGPARLYWGEERIPILQDVIGSVTSLSARWMERH